MALVVGCRSAGVPVRGVETVEGREVLRVGITPNAPPIIYKERSRLAGLEVDFALALAEALNRNIEFVELAWPDQVPALLDHRSDIIMSGMSITPARQLRIAFSDPYLKVGQVALTRAEDQLRYLTPASVALMRGKVGVEKATTGDALVQDTFRRAERVPFTTAEKGARALIKGKIDMLVHDAPVIWWLASVHHADGLRVASAPLTEEHLAWGVRPEDTELLAAVNGVLGSWREDGQLERVLQRWIPYAK